MLLPLGETCLSFGETTFPLEKFLLFTSYFESSNGWYGYLPFFPFSLAPHAFIFATKSFISIRYYLRIHTFLILALSENSSTFFAFSIALKLKSNVVIEATCENGSSSINHGFFSSMGFHHDFFLSKELYYDFLFSKELHCDFFFSKEIHRDILLSKEIHRDFLVDLVLDNILETPTRISTMIPGVVILTIDFFSKLIFAKELVILWKSDELLLHNELHSFYHIEYILGSRIRGL